MISGGGRKRSGRPKKIKIAESQLKKIVESQKDDEQDIIVPASVVVEEVKDDVHKNKEDDKVKGPPKRSWISLFKDLLWYQRSYGDTFVPRKFPGIPDLGPFVAFQRQQYKEMNASQSEAAPNSATSASSSPLPSDAVANDATSIATSESPAPKDKHILTLECKKLLNSIDFDWDWVEPSDYKPASVVDIKYKGNSINTREIVINEGIPIKQVEEEVEDVEKDDTPQVKRKRGRPRKVKAATQGDNDSSCHEDKEESDGQEKTEEGTSKRRKRNKKNAKGKATTKRTLPTRKSARKKGKLENDTFTQAYAIESAKKKKKGNNDLEEAAAALFSLSSNRT
jgi:hypothetical protein